MSKKRNVELQAIVRGEFTSYRVRENPDAPLGAKPGEHGVVIEWSDDGKKWSQQFMVGRDEIDGLREALGYFEQQK